MKKHTSKEILKAIQENAEESRKDWLLYIYKNTGAYNSNNENYQFWRQDNKPIEFYSPEVIAQKLAYILVIISAVNWKVIETEKVTGDSTHSTATITKIDNQNVKIVSSRKNGPVYHLEEYTIPMDWETKKIVKTGTTIKGTITDKDNFEVTYLYGSGTIYSVKLKYTR